jgi:hypothetical protein
MASAFDQRPAVQVVVVVAVSDYAVFAANVRTLSADAAA